MIHFNAEADCIEVILCSNLAIWKKKEEKKKENDKNFDFFFFFSKFKSIERILLYPLKSFLPQFLLVLQFPLTFARDDDTLA